MALGLGVDGFWAQGSGLLGSEDSGLNAVGFGIQDVGLLGPGISGLESPCLRFSGVWVECSSKP